MFSNKILIIILTIFFLPVEFFSQTFSISGKVTDSLNHPLPGVNIIILENNNGAATDLNGKYIIENLIPNVYNLEFSIIGYKSKKNKNSSG